ncbi:hypothetical protein ACTXT7_017530, partial [Hymenolepis weldensis]
VLSASKISTAAVSSNSPNNSTQCPVVPVPLKVLPNAILVQAVSEDVKLLPSVRDSVKVASLKHSMESSISEVVPARPVSEPTVPKQQPVPTTYLLDHQTNQIFRLKGHKESYCTFASFRTDESSTKTKSIQYIGHCNHIRVKSKLVLRPKRLALVDDKCDQPENVSLGKLVSLVNGAGSKVVAQNAGEAALPYR